MKKNRIEGMKTMLACLTLLLAVQSTAQDSLSQDSDSVIYNREIRLVIDNDVFISLTSDSYYSSGLFGYYRHLLRQSNKFKIVRSYSINQRIYTPKSLKWRNVDRYDRPYAGHLSAFASNEYYHHKNRYLKIQFELGWMGPGSQTDDIQTSWHGYFGLPEPQGWRYQIQNSPIVNIYGTYAHTWLAVRAFDVVTETNLALGTAFNHVRQEAMIRLGQLKHIYQSVHYNGVLGEKVKAGKQNSSMETYVFFSPGVEYNIYNTTIEGNLIGPESPHTEEAVSWIWQNKLGFNFSWPTVDWQIFYYARGQETPEAERHEYVGMHINKRF
jgi:hypothetical protein